MIRSRWFVFLPPGNFITFSYSSASLNIVSQVYILSVHKAIKVFCSFFLDWLPNPFLLTFTDTGYYYHSTFKQVLYLALLNFSKTLSPIKINTFYLFLCIFIYLLNWITTLYFIYWHEFAGKEQRNSKQNCNQDKQ